MVGVIRKRDILAHPVVTIRCFGLPVFLRVLIAGRRQTFLSLLCETGVLRPPTVEVPALIGRCVELELRAQRIYDTLAQRFADRDPVQRFFQTLAEQERSHGELLELCRETAGRTGWLEEQFEPWRDAVPRLERQMDGAEASLERLDALVDALRLVIRIEASEINDVFGSVVAATDSEFVRNLEAFQTAGATHLSYISDRIRRYEPGLAAECQRLRAPSSSG
jgi:rubrerythrin